jgi:RimJ/RimL family protein N-acetyltransferase
MGSTRRLRIEALRPEDAHELFEDLGDARLYAFIPDEPPTSVAALRATFQRWCAGPSDRAETWCNWVVFDLGDGTVVGTLQATIVEDGPATIAYTVVVRRWREGLGREAVGWLIHELAARGVRAIEARVDTRNLASIRLLESLGFRRQRTIPEADHFKGSPSDEYVYQRAAD